MSATNHATAINGNCTQYFTRYTVGGVETPDEHGVEPRWNYLLLYYETVRKHNKVPWAIHLFSQTALNIDAGLLYTAPIACHPKEATEALMCKHAAHEAVSQRRQIVACVANNFLRGKSCVQYTLLVLNMSEV